MATKKKTTRKKTAGTKKSPAANTNLTSVDLKGLAKKLDGLSANLTPPEQAYLTGLIGLGSKRLAQFIPDRVETVQVEFDSRNMPDLSQAFDAAFRPGSAGRLPGDVGPELEGLGVLSATSISVSIGTGGPAVGVGVSI